jgi:hypothetical protein
LQKISYITHIRNTELSYSAGVSGTVSGVGSGLVSGAGSGVASGVSVGSGAGSGGGSAPTSEVGAGVGDNGSGLFAVFVCAASPLHFPGMDFKTFEERF